MLLSLGPVGNKKEKKQPPFIPYMELRTTWQEGLQANILVMHQTSSFNTNFQPQVFHLDKQPNQAPCQK